MKRKNSCSTINPSIAHRAAIDNAIEESTMRRDNNLRGKSSTADEIMYRKFVLKTAMQANLSMGQLQLFKPALDAKGELIPNLGHASNLVSDYAGSLLKEEKASIMKKISDSYREFSTTIDGSPIGNDAEAMSLRLVNKRTKKVSENLISVKLHAKKLDGMAIANNAVTSLREYGINRFNYWVYNSMDRAGSNGVAVKELKGKNIAKPTCGPCHSHTTNLPGKEFNDTCALMHKFRKAWNKSICTRGQFYNLIKKHLGKYPVVAGGARWYTT